MTTDLEHLSNDPRATMFPRITKLIAISLMANLLLVVALAVTLVMTWDKKPMLIAVSEDGRAVRLQPVNIPMANDSQVVGFSSECLRKSFSHDYINYRQSMTEASDCFTAAGNASYQSAMQGLVKQMVSSRYVMSEELISPPVVVRSGVAAGVYTWEVRARMKLFREGAVTRMDPVVYDVAMKIQRVGVETNVRGISVVEINLAPGR